MIPDVVARLIGDNTAYVRSLNEAERATKGSTDRSSGHFSKLGGAIGTAMKVGAAAGTVAVGGFFAKAISGASDLSETLSKVGVVFGEQANQVTGFANDMAKRFGLPKTAILDAAASIGLIGKASGLSQGDAAKMSTQLGKLAADASSFYNVPLPEALDAIKSGLVGEAEPMRRFGVLLNEQAVQAEAARLGLAKVNGEYGEGAKAQARASLIMRGMTDASGDLERTQGSLANRLRELRGRAENFAASVGEKVVPGLLKLMDFGERVGAKVGPAIAGVFNILAKGDFTGGIFGLEEDSPVIDALFRIREAGMAVVDWVRAHWPDVRNIIAGVMATVQAAVSGALGVIVPLIERIGPIARDAFGTVADTAGRVGQVLSENKPVIEAVATVITVVLIPALALAAVEAMISAGKQAAAWVITHVQAIASAAIHVAQVALMVGRWVVLGAVAMAQAAIVAAAWIISMGPIALVVAAVVGLAVAFVANWDKIRSAVLTGVMFVVDKFLWMAESVVKQAADAFGWVPGIGPKLREAANRVEGFRDEVNRYLGGIRDKDVRVTITQVRRFIDDPGTQARKTAGYYGPAYHSGGIIAGPRGADVPILGQAGEGIFTRGQMAALGAAAMGTAGAGRGGGGRGGDTYNILNVYPATGDIPDSTIRKLRSQLFEMGNDLPPGSIVPAA